MKIALIYTGYSEKLVSGITNYVQRLQDFLTRKGHRVYLLPGKKYKILPPFLGLYWQIVKPCNYFVLRNFLNKVKPDLVITQGIHLAESRTLTFLRNRSYKWILTQHGFVDFSLVQPLVWFYLKLIGKRIFEKSDHIITISSYTRDKILKYLPDSKISLIPPPVIDFSEFYPKSKNEIEKLRKDLELSPEEPIILGVGRTAFFAAKNFETLIKAIRFVPAKLFIVGGGYGGGRLKKIAQFYKIDSKVRFFKYLPPEKLCQFYNLASITVLPSLSEGLGLVLIESLACQTPVIGSRLGGILEIIQEGKFGLYLNNPLSSQELAFKINYLLEKPKLREKMGREGRIFVKKKFGQEQLFEELEKIYLRITKNPNT